MRVTALCAALWIPAQGHPRPKTRNATEYH
ncbi:hypothetical protein JOF55_004825 [Haloactinomyces albus]|uniref:Uncharacterized protein n=1 Tax=Haloactinomyces albus TaxID=1352928 RepID=A0AAE3ZGM7_9ACTN|nr:hypothetical protein [Haloactinomyces albus]